MELGETSLFSMNNDSQIKIVPEGYDNAQMSQEDFLKVLLANLQWQNPLEAQDISQFIDDTVKLREMEALNAFESSVESLKESLNAYSLVFATGFIGKLVEYEGNQTFVEGGKGRAEFTLSEPAQKVVVTLLSPSGEVVEEKTFYDLDAGSYPFEIDNPELPDGYYTVSVSAYAPDGSPVEVEVKSYALVSGVKRDESGEIYLTTEVSQIPFENIIAVGG